MSDDTPVEELPEGVHHYATAGEAPSEIAKYWHQRYDIFSKFDEGVWLTDDAWFGVTPEPIATYAISHSLSTDRSLTDAQGKSLNKSLVHQRTKHA